MTTSKKKASVSRSNTKKLTLLGSQRTDYKYDKPSVEMLETFPVPYSSKKAPITIKISFPEFTSLCPKTGQPDFATIDITYVPHKLCVESKSLKLYFFAYRNYGGFMEEITQRIGLDLVKLLKPQTLVVDGKFAPRGAMVLHPRFTFQA